MEACRENFYHDCGGQIKKLRVEKKKEEKKSNGSSQELDQLTKSTIRSTPLGILVSS